MTHIDRLREALTRLDTATQFPWSPITRQDFQTIRDELALVGAEPEYTIQLRPDQTATIHVQEPRRIAVRLVQDDTGCKAEIMTGTPGR